METNCFSFSTLIRVSYRGGGGNWDPPPLPRIYENFIIIEKSVQIVNDDKYPLTFPRFVDASIDSPPKPKILYETLLIDQSSLETCAL